MDSQQQFVANFILFIGGALSAIVSGAVIGVPTFLLWLRSSKQNQSIFESLIKGAFASSSPETLQTLNELATALSEATDTIEGLKSAHQDFLDRNNTTDVELLAALEAYRRSSPPSGFISVKGITQSDFDRAFALSSSGVSKENFEKALKTVRDNPDTISTDQKEEGKG